MHLFSQVTNLIDQVDPSSRWLPDVIRDLIKIVPEIFKNSLDVTTSHCMRVQRSLGFFLRKVTKAGRHDCLQQ